MAKTKIDAEGVEVPAEKVAITPIAHEYNREDLNEMRDKLNAVITIVNTLD